MCFRNHMIVLSASVVFLWGSDFASRCSCRGLGRYPKILHACLNTETLISCFEGAIGTHCLWRSEMWTPGRGSVTSDLIHHSVIDMGSWGVTEQGIREGRLDIWDHCFTSVLFMCEQITGLHTQRRLIWVSPGRRAAEKKSNQQNECVCFQEERLGCSLMGVWEMSVISDVWSDFLSV